MTAHPSAVSAHRRATRRSRLVPLLPMAGSDRLTPLVHGGTRRFVNLDYAASTPTLAAVTSFLSQQVPAASATTRASRPVTEPHQSAQIAVGQFVGARAEDDVVFTRDLAGAVDLLNRGLPAGSEVLILDVDDYTGPQPGEPGRRRLVTAAPTLAGTLERLTLMLSERSYALVAVTGSSHLTGEVVPIADIARLAHAAGARLYVDATHLAGCRRLSLTTSGVDYVAFTGHTLATPFPTGVLVGRADWLGAERVGEAPHALGPAALAMACRTIEALTGDAADRHYAALLQRLLDELARLAPIHLHRSWPDSTDQVGIVSFWVDGYDGGRVAAYLSAEHGVGVREESSRAHPLMGPRSSVPTAVRVSFGLGTSSDDIDRLAAGLQELLTHGPRWTYSRIDGRWEPVPDPRSTRWGWAELERDRMVRARESSPLV